MLKKKSKKKKEVKEEVIVETEDIGEVLPITAAEENPVSDGKEFAGGDEDE